MIIISMEMIIMPRMGDDNDDNLGLDGDRDDTVVNDDGNKGRQGRPLG